MRIGLLLLFLSFILAFTRLHLSVKTTQIGYEIGKLKSEEVELLRKKSMKTMELAKLMTKDSLLKFSKK